MEVKGRPSITTVVEVMKAAFEFENNPAFMEENISGMAPLSARLVEKGEVFKTLVVETSGFEVSLLTLLPGSAIAEHWHEDDQEWYILPDKKVVTACTEGNAHSLRNDGNEVMFVVSIKFKNTQG